MQEYDIALKLLLQQASSAILQELTGKRITRWLNVELPKVQNPRVDLLGETENSELIHLELQSTNDGLIVLRMAEYCLPSIAGFASFPARSCYTLVTSRFA